MSAAKRAYAGDARHCSFCHRSTEEVERLIAGPEDVYICDECVALCIEILEEEKQQETQGAGRGRITDLPPPREIFAAPGRVRHRSGAGQKGPVGGGLQPLQAHQRRRQRWTTSS